MGVIIKESIKGTLTNYIGAFIGFLSTYFVIVYFLPPEIIGLTRILVEAATLMSVFMQLGVTSSVIRFYPVMKTEDGKNNGFFFYLLTVPALGSLLVIPLFLIFSSEIIDYYSDESGLFADNYRWIIPLSLFLTYLGVFEVYANVLMRIAVPKFIREVCIRLMHMAIYVLYGFGILDLEQFLGAYVLVFAFAAVVNLLYIKKIGSVCLRHDFKSLDRGIKKDFLRYTLFLMIGVISGSVTSRIDLFMVGGEMGLAYAGIYSIAFYMVAIIEIPSRSITAISSPVVSQAMKSGDIDKANSLYKGISANQLLIGGMIFIVLWANADNIFDILPNGEIYRSGKYVIFFLGLSRLFTLFLGFGHALISYSRYYAWTLMFALVVTVITIAANNLLIPVMGMTGASAATLASTVISLAFQQFIVFRKLKCNPYSVSTIKIIAILFIAFAVNTVLPEFENPWADAAVRTAIVGGMMVLAAYFTKASYEFRNMADSAISYFAKKIRKI